MDPTESTAQSLRLVASRLYSGRGPLFVLALWFLLWSALSAAGLSWPPDAAGSGWNSLRTWFPLLAGLGAGLLLARRQVAKHALGLDPSYLLIGYALVGVLASILYSPLRVNATYWGLAFLAVPFVWFVALRRYATPSIRWIPHLNAYLCLGFATAFVLLAIWKLNLLGLAMSGTFRPLYNTVPDVPILGRAVSSNGIARFAAVASLVALARALRSDWRLALPWVPLVGASGLLIIYTLSRTALVALIGAAFVVGFLRLGWKGLAAGVVLLAGAVWAFGPAAAFAYWQQNAPETFLNLSGRDRIWSQAWDLFLESPLIGFGFHADRIMLAEHVHNAWLHSLVQAGLVGGVLFFFAWFIGWRASLRLGFFRRFRAIAPRDRDLLIETSGIFAFLSVRSLAESSGAFFGVDLFLLVPVLGVAAAMERKYVAAANLAVPAAGPSPEGRPRVLACAYACAPPDATSFSGGEDLLGWRFTNQLSRFFDVWALTSAHHKADLEAALARSPNPYLRFVYVDVPRPLRWLRHYPGGVQFAAYVWQVRAHFVARRLHDVAGFQLFHHVTYANDWMASHTGALLKIPYVRGPGGGAHKVPPALRGGRPLKFRFGQWLRTFLQHVLRLDPFFRLDRRRSAAILLCMRESYELLPPMHQAKVFYFPVIGVTEEDFGVRRTRPRSDPFTVVTAGKLLPAKGFDLAVRAFAKFLSTGGSGRLIILGEGPERGTLEALVRDLAVADRVELHGWKPRSAVQQAMADAELLLFPSLRDGGGAVVVEAMAVGIPVVCLDLGGPGIHVDATCGIKVPPGKPVEVVDGLAAALMKLFRDADLRERLGASGRARARDVYLWDRLGETAYEIDRAVLEGGGPPTSGRAAATPGEVAFRSAHRESLG